MTLAATVTKARLFNAVIGFLPRIFPACCSGLCWGERIAPVADLGNRNRGRLSHFRIRLSALVGMLTRPCVPAARVALERYEFTSLNKEGAGNAGRLTRTHSLVCKSRKHTS